ATRHRKRELGAGAQTGMSGNSLQDIHGMRTIVPERTLHCMQVLPDTFVFRTGNVSLCCASDHKTGFKIADRKFNPAKLAAKPAIDIKKTEMEPGRNGDENCRWSWRVITEAHCPAKSLQRTK